jgi:hypothetical protein
MNPFRVPTTLHQRRHGPIGYVNYKSFKDWLRDEFAFQCTYCLKRERWNDEGHRRFSCDHVIAQSIDRARVCDYDNLVYACVACNSLKRNLYVLDPCAVAIGDHVEVLDTGEFRGRTPEGLFHIEVLQLNDEETVASRLDFITTLTLLASDPRPEARKAIIRWMGYPLQLPKLHKLRPPHGNTRPEGVAECFYLRRQRGELPPDY